MSMPIRNGNRIDGDNHTVNQPQSSDNRNIENKSLWDRIRQFFGFSDKSTGSVQPRNLEGRVSIAGQGTSTSKKTNDIFRQNLDEFKTDLSTKVEKLKKEITENSKDTSAESLKKLRENIKQLKVEIESISKQISSFKTNAENALSTNPRDPNLLNAWRELKPKLDLLKETKQAYEELLQDALVKFSNMEKPILKAEREEIKKQFPGASSLEKGAKTFQAGREALSQLSGEDALKPMGTSVNLVTRVRGHETTSYVKVGSKGESAAAVMEKFMYNFAQVLGMGNLFAGTKEIKVHLKGDLTPNPLERDPTTGQHIVPAGMEKVNIWVENKLFKVKDDSGIQRFMSEKEFNQYEKDNPGKLKLLVGDKEGKQSFMTKTELDQYNELKMNKVTTVEDKGQVTVEDENGIESQMDEEDFWKFRVQDENGKEMFVTQAEYDDYLAKNPGKDLTELPLLKVLVEDKEGKQSFMTIVEATEYNSSMEKKEPALKIISDLQRDLQVYGAKSSKVAGIQPAEEGMLLGEYIDLKSIPKDQKPIEKSTIIKGTLTALKMGMGDAHADNIMVTKEGELRFFDNTRSLAHGVGPIKNDGRGLISPYRCGLLELKESFEDLSQGELDECLSDLQAFLKQIDAGEKYLDLPSVKKQMESLPYGWYDQKKIIDAMRQRTQNMISALENKQVKNLRDLAFAANPIFKFAAVLEVLTSIKKDNIKTFSSNDFLVYQKSLLANVGYHHLDELLEDVHELGFDVKAIKEWCDDPNESIDSILIACKSSASITPADPTAIKNYHEVLDGLYESSELDNKDVSRKTILEVRKKKLRDLGCQVLTVKEEDYKAKIKQPTFVNWATKGKINIILVLKKSGNADYMLAKKGRDGKLQLEKIDSEKFIRDLEKA